MRAPEASKAKRNDDIVVVRDTLPFTPRERGTGIGDVVNVGGGGLG